MQLRAPRTVTQKALSFLLVFTGALILVFGVLVLEKPTPAQATSGELSTARGVYPNITGTTLDSCSLCHTSAPSLNSYGNAYKNNGKNAAALRAIEGQDSDGDGFSNIVEINALSFPGDAKSVPPSQPTATRTLTRTATATTVPPTATRTATATSAPATATRTATKTATNTPAAATPTLTRTITPGMATPTKTNTPGMPTPTRTLTQTPAVTATMTPTATPGGSKTPTTVPGSVVLTPVEDSYISQRSRSQEFGANDNMRVDQSPLYRSFLRFDLGGITRSTIKKAELKVYVVEGSDKGFRVRAVKNTTWKEKTLNYSNAPHVDDSVGRGSQAVAGKWITVDITSYIKNAGRDDDEDDDSLKPEQQALVSLALYGDSTNGFIIASKERSGFAPQLVITR